MTRILIVEDSATQATQLRIILQDAGYQTLTAKDGVLALETLAQESCDIVLSDLHMPNMNGLELVAEIRTQYPTIPVILVTHDGSENIAAEALQKGAASYIPKHFLEKSLLPTLAGIRELLEPQKSKKRVLETLVESRATYVLSNQQELVPHIVQHLESELRTFDYGDETGLFQISMALTESLTNAMEHGNLELSSELRADGEAYQLERSRRCELTPYRDRKVTLTVEMSAQSVHLVVSDEGTGFDPSTIPDPTDPENLMRENGRGLMLIYSFMDEVRHNDVGNQITMIKHRQGT